MRYWLETLGCPKNQVDSDKLSGRLEAEGYVAASGPATADLVVVNTCAFIDQARRESVDTVMNLSRLRSRGARLVVTGCLAERYGQELADAMPEVDLVAGFGVPVNLTGGRGGIPAPGVPKFDLLNLPRPRASAPWAYVKVAEGCDRKCGFCAIPTFRGKQRSRDIGEILAEVEALDVEEVVLVAQDLASYGRDTGSKAIETLVEQVSDRVARVRLLYLYPSELSDGLIAVMVGTGCPYFDLSLQHVSRDLLKRMRRFGDGSRFLERIGRVRAAAPDAALRSSFIIGYPGETEEDHDLLLAFLEEAELDWAGFFEFSPEDGTYAAGLGSRVPRSLVKERLAECSELQDRITASRRLALVGEDALVLVDSPGACRSHREAPEIDGIVRIPSGIPAGTWLDVRIVDAEGPDLDAVPMGAWAGPERGGAGEDVRTLGD
jgi:ribosomal protein S12 methylthiotransferase